MSYRYNPYIVGTPVEGKDFYGREELLNKIWRQQTPIVHLIGMRRIGKTSILKELAASRGTAIYLDLQEVGDWAEFAEVLQYEIEAAQPQFPWLPVADLSKKSTNWFRLLKLLDQHFQRAGGRLWVLLDEVEVLIELGQADIKALRKFQSFLRHVKALQFVFASAKRLIELNELASGPGYGSPFLNEFPPPIYIDGLDSKAAIALIRQSKNPPPFPVPDDIAHTICRRTNNHPYLIQWVCGHLWDKNPDPTAWHIDDNTFKAPPTLQEILRKDFNYLSDPERRVIQAVLVGQSLADIYPLYTEGLTSLGYLRQTDTGYEIGNDFFKNCLLDLQDQDWTKPSQISARFTLNLYKKTSNQKKEHPMTDPYSLTWALMVMEKATEFLFTQAGETLKEWREKRKKGEETPASLSSETEAESPISDSKILMTTLEEQLGQLEKQAGEASYRMQVQKVESLMKQLEDYNRNKLMYEEEAAKLPNLDDRVALRRRIEDIDNHMAQKAGEMRQTLEQLSQRKIHIPVLDE